MSIVFVVTGEIYLRNFSVYGVAYFIKFNKEISKNDIRENELNFIPLDVLDDVERLKGNLQQEANQNTYRIVILGDSIADGGELKNVKLRFLDRMKEILQRTYPSVSFDILICAAGGWSTAQEVSAYEKYYMDIRHDLVILAYCQNDDAEAWQKIRIINGRLFLAFYKATIPYVSIVPLNKFFTERLLIARFINEWLIKLSKHYNLKLPIRFCLIQDEKIYNAFKKLSALTSSKGIPVMVVVFPHLDEENAMHDARMSGLIKVWCKDLKLEYVNLIRPYRSYGLKKLRANYDDDIHPNSVGHKIAAEEITKELKKMGLLSSLTSPSK